jgi:hypothetical protein
MPVAKSYQKYKIVGQPFKDNGKMYVVVMTDKGNHKTVRWYNETEYIKMYPEVKEDLPGFKPQKDVLGFGQGYITIFKGIISDEIEEWFDKNKVCRWAKWWGWYVPSQCAVPQDYPQGVIEIVLKWDEVGQDNGYLKQSNEVVKAVRAKLAEAVKPDATSTRQGKIGERLDIKIEIVGKQEEEDKRYHRFTYTYEMKDGKGNFYKWKTQAKNWSVGTRHHIRGTVKEYGEISGEPATILTRCIEP